MNVILHDKKRKHKTSFFKRTTCFLVSFRRKRFFVPKVTVAKDKEKQKRKTKETLQRKEERKKNGSSKSLFGS